MRALILAAGRGSRMGSHTDLQPKCRTVLHGKSLLDWQFLTLQSAGVNEIAVVTGYLSETFQNVTTTFHNELWHSSNMVFSLLQARDWLLQEPCLVVYSDIVFGPKIVQRLKQDKTELLATAFDVNWQHLWEMRFKDPTTDAESFALEGELVVDIGQQIQDCSKQDGQFMGLLRFTPTSWQQIEQYLHDKPDVDVKKLDMTGLLHGLIQHGIDIKGVPNYETWYEVDSPSDLALYESLSPVI